MPDPDGVRALARRSSLLGGQVDVLAGQVEAARQVDWVSTRSEEFKDDLAQDARDIRAAADELLSARQALDRHADDVQHRLDQISSAMGMFGDLLDGARKTLDNAADGVSDAATQSAQRLVDLARSAPSPGSLDWPDFLGRSR